MNKKLVTILLSGVLSLGLYGCSNTTNDAKENSNTDTKVEEKQSNGKETVLSSGYYIAGEDFEPGIYTIIAIKGNGNVSSSNLMDGGINATMAQNAEELNANIGSEMYDTEYKNIRLPKGTELKIDGLTVQLVPKGQEPSKLEDVRLDDTNKEDNSSNNDAIETTESSNNKSSNKSDNLNTTKKYYCGTCGKEISKSEKEASNRCNSCQSKRNESSNSTKVPLEGDTNGDGVLDHYDDYDDSDYEEYNNTNNGHDTSQDNNSSSNDASKTDIQNSNSNNTNYDLEEGTLLPND